MAHRIILADTQAIFLTGAARFISRERDMHVVEECSDLSALIAAIEQHPRSIVILPMDIAPDLTPLLDRVERAESKSVVIVEDGARLDRVIAHRINGVVWRSVAGPRLVERLRLVADGRRCVRQAETEAAPAADAEGNRVLGKLTEKDLRIVSLVTRGAKNREIAQQLGTSEQMIKNELRNIYEKMGVSDRLQLVLFTQHHRAVADAATRMRQELQVNA